MICFQASSSSPWHFSKLEKEALVKGIPIGQALDLDIPPPRPKRKPSNPYPRKTSAGAPTIQSGAKHGKLLISVDRSSCGSNTASSSEEKDEKEKEESGTPDANHLAAEPSNRRSRSISNSNPTDSWKEVSEEGRVAFQALFSREVLPQSFSPQHDLINKDHHQMDNIKDNKQNADYKDEDLDSKKCSSNCEGVQKYLSSVENNNEEEGLLLTIGLGQGKLNTRLTGFKPYKRCSVEANENMVGKACNQGEEKGPKRIRLEGEASI